MKKVLAFFGAFNPPTIAHLQLAELAMRSTGRDGVIFVPSRMDYIRYEQQKDYAYTDEQRLVMLMLAARERSWMEVCGWELEQARQPRTYETLCHLREEGFDPSLLIGSDKLSELRDGWLFVEEIVREFGIVCLAREEDDVKKMILEDPYLNTLKDGITPVVSPKETRQISSSAVRKKIRKIRELEEEIGGMLSPEIRDYLLKDPVRPLCEERKS